MSLALPSAHYNLYSMSLAGIYIHIPFCRSRCSYCDFATGLYEGQLADSYVDAVVTEISRAQEAQEIVDTIYFGGGTPSLLSAPQVDRILKKLKQCFDVEDGAEITMEMNPGTVS